MGPAEIYAWTAWAYSNHIEYHGWGYKFPADPDLPDISRPLKVEKVHRYAVTHRKKSKSFIDGRNIAIPTKISAKALRREWYHQSRKQMSFKEFMAKRGKTRGGLSELSAPVIQALTNLYTVRPPKKEVKLVQRPTESRAQYRARMSEQYNTALEMTERASAELYQKVRHLTTLGIVIPFRNRSEEYRRARQILGFLGSNVGAPTASYGLVFQALLRSFARVNRKLEEHTILSDSVLHGKLIVEYEDILHRIYDMVGATVKPKVDRKNRTITCCRALDGLGDKVVLKY
jgi:hypothetical protein